MLKKKIALILAATGVSTVLFPFTEFIFDYKLVTWLPPTMIVVGLGLLLAGMIVDVATD